MPLSASLESFCLQRLDVDQFLFLRSTTDPQQPVSKHSSLRGPQQTGHSGEKNDTSYHGSFGLFQTHLGLNQSRGHCGGEGIQAWNVDHFSKWITNVVQNQCRPSRCAGAHDQNVCDVFHTVKIENGHRLFKADTCHEGTDSTIFCTWTGKIRRRKSKCNKR